MAFDIEAAEKEALETMKASLKDLSTPQKRKAAMEEYREKEQSEYVDEDGDTFPALPEGFSLSRYMRGLILNTWTEAKKERDVFETYREKAWSPTSGAQGAVLIPRQVSDQIIELLKAQAVMRKAGAMVLRIRKGRSMDISKRVGTGQHYWINGDTDDYSTEAYGTSLMGSRNVTLRDLVAFAAIPNMLLEDASPAVDTLIKKDIAEEIALAEDYAFILGAGANEPVGIYNWSGVGSTTLTAALTTDDLYTAQTTIEEANGKYTTYLMNPRGKDVVRKIKDGLGLMIWQRGDITKQQPDTLLGQKCIYSNQIPNTYTYGDLTDATFAILMDPSEFIIAEKGGIAIDTNTQSDTAFKYNQTHIRAIRRVSCLVRQEDCFHIIKGIRRA